MILKKINLKNIRSYESAEIEFPEGSTVLAGDIGSGKTSVLLAIEFALFGLQPGQRGGSLLRNGKNEGSVSLELNVEGQEIIVERGLKRGKSISQSYAKIIIDGQEKELSITELKNNVLSLLNYPKEFAKKTNILYRFTVYTPQEEMKQIILETPETRLNTLRHVFGIDKYKKIKENTSMLTAKLREKVRFFEGEIKGVADFKKNLEEKQSNIEKISQNLGNTEKELEERKKQRELFEQDLKQIDEKIQEKRKYENETEKTQVMLIGKRAILEEIEKEKKSILEELEESKKLQFDESNLEKIKAQMLDIEKQSELHNNSYMETLSQINSFNSEISSKQKLKENISSLELCPTCLQNVDEGYKQNIMRGFDEIIEKNSKQTQLLEENKKQIILNLESLKINILELKKQEDEFKIIKFKLEGLKEKEEKILRLDAQKISTEKDFVLLQKQIETLRNSASALKKYDYVYEEKRKGLDKRKSEEREKEIELASLKKEKEMTLKNIEEIEIQIKEKEKIKKKLQEIAEFEDWLSEQFLSVISFTEKNIMTKLREEFSKLFNEWFNILVPEIFTVHLDENFTPVINQQDYSLDYSFLSGGERTAIALSYRLALNQVVNSLLSKIKTNDIVILDEPTDGFSEQQLDKMRDVLQELNVKQLIIVSHEAKIESFVENIIKFSKEDGITKISA